MGLASEQFLERASCLNGRLAWVGLAQIVFDGIVKDVTSWHSGNNVEFTRAFATKHQTSGAEWRTGLWVGLDASVNRRGATERSGRVLENEKARTLVRGAAPQKSDDQGHHLAE